MPLVDHVDLVVSSIERSLPFYRGLLRPLGWLGVREVRGERGETIHYLWGPDLHGSIGLRARPSNESGEPYDRYTLGLHHLAFEAPSRAAVDNCARWLSDNGATIESGPGEYDYTPRYYAVFFYDPDGMKLELVHRPRLPAGLSRAVVRRFSSLATSTRWETTSVHVADVDPEAIWRCAYADPAAWPRWNPELAAARLDGPFALGSIAHVRFRTGLRLRFRIIAFDAGRLFTDEARLPLARMGHRHLVESTSDGVRLTNTIYIQGPLAGLWSKLLGPRAARALPQAQREIVSLARQGTASGGR